MSDTAERIAAIRARHAHNLRFRRRHAASLHEDEIGCLLDTLTRLEAALDTLRAWAEAAEAENARLRAAILD